MVLYRGELLARSFGPSLVAAAAPLRGRRGHFGLRPKCSPTARCAGYARRSSRRPSALSGSPPTIAIGDRDSLRDRRRTLPRRVLRTPPPPGNLRRCAPRYTAAAALPHTVELSSPVTPSLTQSASERSTYGAADADCVSSCSVLPHTTATAASRC